MNADMADPSSPYLIDLTLDRQTRRKMRRSAGRSGGVFQVAHDASSPWDLEYINQYEFEDHFFLRREAQPFSFYATSSDNEQGDEAKTMLSTPQRHPDKADAMHKGDSDNDEDNFYVKAPAQNSAPNASYTDIEETTLLSALPSRLNLRKVSDRSIRSPDLELPSSVTQCRRKGAIPRSEQVSNTLQTSSSSTAQLSSNMDSLARYLEEKLAALRGTRSKGKPAPGFLTIHPQPSGIGTLQTQYRAHGVYNNKRAGMSEFSLEDQTALLKITNIDEQAESHTAHSESHSLQKNISKTSKFRELVNSIDAKEFEELPTLAGVRTSEVSTLHLPEPVLDAQRQSTSQALAMKPEQSFAGVPKRKPLPEGAAHFEAYRVPSQKQPQSQAQALQRPQARRQYTTSYLNRSLPSIPPPPAAPRQSTFPPEVKDPSLTASHQPPPSPALPTADLTPEQKYHYLRQQIEALSETDGRPVQRLWNCLLRDLPDAEERYTLFLQHRAHMQGTTRDFTGSNDMFQDGWEAYDHEEEWRAEKREGALNALEGKKM